MKLRIIKIGKIKYPELESYGLSFLKKLQADISIELEVRKEETLDNDGISKLLKSFDQFDFVFALNEHAKPTKSVDFSKKIYDRLEQPQWKRINLVIGGPYGLPVELTEKANEGLSLSPMTFTSDLAFAVLCEQIYRAVQIKKGTGYHHD